MRNLFLNRHSASFAFATVAALAVLSLSGPSFSQTAVSPIAAAPDLMWPNADYDPAIPTPRSVLGYDIGERITPPSEIIRYFEALQTALPERVKIFDYGRTWQNRRLIYVAIGAPEQIRNLDAIKANSLALADPRRTTPAQSDAIIAAQPTIIWLANSVHGDEISPADSSMMVAYHLLASRGDNRMANIRQNSLTIIVPSQNPDGRARVLANNEQAIGLEADADELAAERDQPWPGGRMNHYNFDLNRDWISLTQPETQGHVAAYLQWYPTILVDAHEMSRDETFFFPPEADPINPFHTAGQRALRASIGRNNARWFDNFGFNYFTREIFDGFYPGYGDGWPTAHGTIALTYEQGSSRGLRSRGRDGNVLTYRDTVHHHFVAAMSTIEVGARDRQQFLRSFYEFRRTAISEGQSAGNYFIPTQSDQASADKMAQLMVRQGIDVKVANGSFNACGNNYGAGSYIVSGAQPSSRLIRNLLDRNVALDRDFIARQQDRRNRGLEDEIYDVTAWSLPLMFNVVVANCNANPQVATNPVTPQSGLSGNVLNPDAKVGYVVASGSAAYIRFEALALRNGLKMRALEESFTLEGKAYPAGSIVLLNSENSDGLGGKVALLANQSGANIVGFDDSWVTNGPSLGSPKAVKLRLPRIAIAWDAPTDPYSAGNTRFVIERNIGFNVTPIRTRNLRSASMARFDVLILPDTNAGYLTMLGEDGISNLKAYVQNGGTIIALGGATRFLAAPNVELLATRRETATPSGEARSRETSATVAGTSISDKSEYENTIKEDAADPISVDGAIVRVETSEPHWLTQGLPANLYVMYQGSDIFRPLNRANGANPLLFSSKPNLVASGVVWEANQEQMALKPYAMVQPRGRGFVIGINSDLTYRAHSDGLNALLLNAIVQSTARANPGR
ncbi:MAG: M14 family metallopeptidase [Pseudomonadota bacterium]